MNITSSPDEQLQRLQIELMLPSFQVLHPFPVTLCRQLLAKIPPDQSSFLAVTSLELFAGFTQEDAQRAEWSHIYLDEGVIWDPERLAWRQLKGACSWLGYIWNRGATGNIYRGLGTRMAGLKMQLFIREELPSAYRGMTLVDTHRAYCVYPDAFPPQAQYDQALWQQLQSYRRKGAQLQRLTPAVVYDFKKPLLDDPVSGSTDSTGISTDLQLI